MKKSTYHNRYMSINTIVAFLTKAGEATATSISKHVNLSRQAILEALKHAETWGYVERREEPYRQGKRIIWKATDYGSKNAEWLMKAMSNYQLKQGNLL